MPVIVTGGFVAVGGIGVRTGVAVGGSVRTGVGATVRVGVDVGGAEDGL